MDKQIDSMLNDLLKYIPFIDFALELDSKKYHKFIEMKKWIINKKRFAFEDLKKMELAIDLLYKKLFLSKQKIIPHHIQEIFCKVKEEQFVNLCSDDEDASTNNDKDCSSNRTDVADINHESDNDDDIEIVQIFDPPKVETKTNHPETRENNCTINESLDCTSNYLLGHIDAITNADNQINLSHPDSEEEEEKLFKRRSPILFQRRQNLSPTETKHNDEEKGELCRADYNKNVDAKSLPNIITDTISLDSSSDEEDPLPNTSSEKNSKQRDTDDNTAVRNNNNWKNNVISNENTDSSGVSISTIPNDDCNLNDVIKEVQVEASQKKSLQALSTFIEQAISMNSNNEQQTDEQMRETLLTYLLDACNSSPASPDMETTTNQQFFQPKLPDNQMCISPQFESVLYPQNMQTAFNTNMSQNTDFVPVLALSAQQPTFCYVPQQPSLANPQYPNPQYPNPQYSNPQYPNRHYTNPQYQQPNTSQAMTTRKVNLKDPRIRRGLNSLNDELSKLNCPQYKTYVESLLNTTASSFTVNTPTMTKEPANYCLGTGASTHNYSSGTGSSTPNYSSGTGSSTPKQYCQTNSMPAPTVQKVNNSYNKKGPTLKKSSITYSEYKKRRAETEKKRQENVEQEERSKQESSQNQHKHGAPINRTAEILATLSANTTRPQEAETTESDTECNATSILNEGENVTAERKKLDMEVAGAKRNPEQELPEINTSEKTKIDKISRDVRGLECTINGFNSIQDYISKTACGRRRSSVSASSAIVDQLKEMDLTESTSSPSATIGKRRSSVSLSGSSKCRKIDDETLQECGNKTTMNEKVLANQPIVLARRLTQSEIQQYSKGDKISKSKTILNVELVETNSMPVKASTVSKKSRPEKLNNDCQMTETNTKRCALCSSRPGDLTNHYIRKHKTESYISRLTWSQLEELAIKTPFATIIPTKNSRVPTYSVECFFCKEDQVGKFMSLYAHYSMHTGEYGFKCSSCSMEKPYRPEIESHILRTKRCKSGRVETVYCYEPRAMVIYLHYCGICNFVQINEANIHKHLREHHDLRQAIDENVKKTILVAINDGSDDDDTEEEENVSLHSNEVIIKTDKLDLNPENEICIRNEACSEELLDDPLLCQLDNKLKEMHEDSEPKIIMTPTDTLVATPTALSLTQSTLESEQELKILKYEPMDIGDVSFLTPPRTYVQKSCSFKRVYRDYPLNVEYLGLYKCLADDCFYSSDLSDELKKHLEDHENEKMSGEYLKCAYCDMFDDTKISAQQLVDHIEKQHFHMIYQCPVCCYRSCEASNVLMHHEQTHPDTKLTCKIYKCSGTERLLSTDYINEKIAENVKKIQCPYCHNKSYYNSHLLQCHIKTEHNMPIHEKLTHFSCIYCPLLEKDQNVVRKHVALQHPDEMPYICDHNDIETGTEDVLENLKAIHLCQTVEFYDTLNENVNENIQNAITDVKPNLEDLLKCQEQTINVRLYKLTERTGIPPDCLFHCPDPLCGGFFSNFENWLRHVKKKHCLLECHCPHCANDIIRPLEYYKDHFEIHRRHTYICYHCPKTFVNCECAEAHALKEHADLGQFRFEQTRFNLSYSYFVAIQNGKLTNRMEFIPALSDMLSARLKEEEYSNFNTHWLMKPDPAQWYQEMDVKDVMDKKNRRMFICSVCCTSFKSRIELANHIKDRHAARDVPMVQVFINEGNYFIALSVAHAKEHLTFSTMHNCFCCSEQDMRGDAFILHLKRFHKFVINYFCEICNKAIESLDCAQKHSKESHSQNKLKIRGDLASKNDISIISINPFKLHIHSDNICNIKIKQEPDDNSNIDDSVIYMEHDDITLENHIKEQQLKTNNSAKPTLKCIATMNLLAAPIATESHDNIVVSSSNQGVSSSENAVVSNRNSAISNQNVGSNRISNAGQIAAINLQSEIVAQQAAFLRNMNAPVLNTLVNKQYAAAVSPQQILISNATSGVSTLSNKCTTGSKQPQATFNTSFLNSNINT